MVPTTTGLLGALIAAGIGAAVLLAVVGVRGTVIDPTRPPGRLERTAARLRSPALAARAAAAAVAAGMTLLLTRWPVAAAGIGLLVLCWPALFGGTRAEQAQIGRLEALVTWTEALRDTITAHASLEQAIPATAARAPVVIRDPLVRLSGQLRAQVPIERALLGLAGQLDDASADLIIAALILSARRRGDGLAAVLSGLAAAAREELDLRRRVSAGRAGVRRGSKIIIAITIAFTAFLLVFSPTYVAPYSSPGGQLALAVVLALFAGGFAWMRKLSGSEPAAPFLARPDRVPDEAELRLVAGLTGLPAAAAAALTVEPGAAMAGGVR